MTVLKVEDLSVKIRQGSSIVSLVDNVSLSLEPGKTVALIGQSGSGKTLTALAIMGLLPANFIAKGSICFKDKDLLLLTNEERRKYRGASIAYTLQNPGSLNPSLKIKKQLLEKSFSLNRKQALTLLNQVGLNESVLNLYPYQLSGGMKQRVLLAIALAQKPSILIADEPTSGLDIDSANQALDLIDKLRNVEKISTILISHDLGLVGSRADYIVVMKEGCIVEQGPKEKVFNKPVRQYTKALLEASYGIA